MTLLPFIAAVSHQPDRRPHGLKMFPLCERNVNLPVVRTHIDTLVVLRPQSIVENCFWTDQQLD